MKAVYSAKQAVCGAPLNEMLRKLHLIQMPYNIPSKSQEADYSDARHGTQAMHGSTVELDRDSLKPGQTQATPISIPYGSVSGLVSGPFRTRGSGFRPFTDPFRAVN